MITLDTLLAAVDPKLARLEEEMSSAETALDPAKMAQLGREHRRLADLIAHRDRLSRLARQIADTEEMLNDPELGELAAQELLQLQQEHETTEQKLRHLLVPPEPADSRNAVLEIRAGTGGEEAALFGETLYSMYSRYFELRGWKSKVLSATYSDLGGTKEIIVLVTGEDVYGRLKMESGVHRVQRVPVTEASGRIHTSAATVAVLPEAEEVDVHIDPNDLRIDTFRSSGPGGQHVNKTESAIRITHIPTGLVVSCQDEKSQLKNKVQALKVLRSRLFQRALEDEQLSRASQRRQQVTSGDRSAKIRTYNFPQNRVTDHRVPITIYQLEEILQGNLDQLLDPLADHFANVRLQAIMEEER